MADLPEPMTPVDCDLRDYTFMPLDIVRLFGSEFHALSTDAEWRAGVTLWCKSFHQQPAASLPDDDVALCRLAELGRDVKGWKKLRDGALRGWVKCADGRLYHPVVAEKANDAWEKKVKQRARSRAGNEKRWGKDGVSDPLRTEKTSLKDSHKDSLSGPSTIPRDRDRDRDTSSLRSERAQSGAVATIEPEASKPRKPTDDVPEIPGWIPLDAWNGFMENRRKLRKIPTPRAISLLISDLDRYRREGFNPAEILDRSTQNSWIGLVDPKTLRGRKPNPSDIAADWHLNGIDLDAEAERFALESGL